MKVLAGPRVDLRPDGVAARLCRLLAGDDGEAVSLAAAGLRNPYRRFSAAEIAALRGLLRGETGVVGYVCTGMAVGTGRAGAGAPGAASAATGGATAGAAHPATALGGAAREAARLVVVTDHVNLTWRSPLEGPNDDGIGARFPSMDGIYAPDLAAARCGAEGDVVVARGVVAGVVDDRALDTHDTEALATSGWAAVSSELVAPVIVAAHMGLHIAAVVLI